MATSWDPEQYLKFERERARAFHDLVGQVADVSPQTVTDLGCGPGQLTATLADRWPHAYVLGVDSSAEMVAEATRLVRPGRLDFVQCAIEEWRQPEPVDLILSNAALQWVPTHVDLLAQWVTGALAPAGTLAFQVPASGGSAATVAIRTVAASPEWAPRLGALAMRRGPRAASSVRTADEYVDLLARLGCAVDAWETTYLHVLHGDSDGANPVLEWFAGTGLRPYLDALAGDPAAEAAFRNDVAEALAEAYPPAPYGTIMPFRRIFVVARRS
ncbi:MAG TPA: methyltransferase domain-containing protein [Micromonosporaceae bacterium]|nr:methyltransferase domain-containing protein [Micromonosporaceae bacterium]